MLEDSINHGKNICRLFLILKQFPFTTSERELDYYHQMVNKRVASRVAKRIKDYRKLRNSKNIPEMLGIDGEILSPSPKKQILTVVL